MSLSSSSSLLSLLSIAVIGATTACSFQLGEQTKGEQGVLSFEYTSLDCLFGCGVEKPALAGSEVTITTRGLDPSKRYAASMTGASIGKITRQSESCSCTSSSGSTSSSRGVDATASCGAGETKECFHQVTIATDKVGDAKLEMRVGNELVDSTTIKARAATRIDVTARIDGNDLPPKDGTYEAKVGTSVYLSAKAYDDNGPLVTGDDGIALASADKKVLSVQSYLLGVRAVSAGETDLTLTATGTQSVMRFRIVE